MKGADESRRWSRLQEESKAREQEIADLKAERELLVKQRDEAKGDLLKARDEASSFRDEAEEMKLELERSQKDFEGKLMEARDIAIEDFKMSEEFKTLRGEYAMGSYFHALKEARSFLRSRPEAKPEDLKGIPNVAGDLELSESEEATEDVDVEGDEDDEDEPTSANDHGVDLD